jgi:hypothetical protein
VFDVDVTVCVSVLGMPGCVPANVRHRRFGVSAWQGRGRGRGRIGLTLTS